MKRRDRAIVGTLFFLVAVGFQLAMGWLDLGYVAQAVTGVMVLLLGVVLTGYCLTLLRQLWKHERCASWSDQLGLFVMMLTGLIPVVFFIWMCLVRFKTLAGQ